MNGYLYQVVGQHLVSILAESISLDPDAVKIHMVTRSPGRLGGVSRTARTTAYTDRTFGEPSERAFFEERAACLGKDIHSVCLGDTAQAAILARHDSLKLMMGVYCCVDDMTEC